MPRAQRTCGSILLAASAALAFAAAATAQTAETLVWKPVLAASLKIDDQPVRLWNVYQPEKKAELVLVQIGLRYLFIDVAGREVFEMAPENYQRKGNELRGPRADKSATPLPTENWMVRPAGRVLRVQMKLVAEGRVLEVQLPHTPDLRRFY